MTATGMTDTGSTVTGEILTLSGDLVLSSPTVTIMIASGSEIQALDSDKKITEAPVLSEISINEDLSSVEQSEILNDPQIAGELSTKKSEIVDSAFEFGSSGSHLIFSAPARVEMDAI